MPQLAPDRRSRERAARLRAAGEAALAAELASRVGSETDVLIERPGRAAPSFTLRSTFAEAAPPGSIRRMRLVESSGTSLVGVPVE